MWSSDFLYYANPPFSLVPKVIDKILRDKTKTLLLIAPIRAFKTLLWPHLVDNPLVLDTVAPTNLFLPPDKQHTTDGIGPPPWGETAAWLVSGETKKVQDFQRHFVPKLVKLTDRLTGSAKANFSPAEITSRAKFFLNQLNTKINNTSLKFETLEAALNARWDEVQDAAKESSFQDYPLPAYESSPPANSIMNCTPLFTYITVNKFNVMSLLDSGSSTTLVSTHPALEHAFPRAMLKPLPPIPISGIGKSQATHYIKQEISFRGMQGQYITLQPTFLVASIDQPIIIIGNDVLKHVKMMLVNQENPFALSLYFPDYVIPCANSPGEIPTDHLRYAHELINGIAVMRDINPRLSPIADSQNNPQAQDQIQQAAISATFSFYINTFNLTSPFTITTFPIDTHSNTETRKVDEQLLMNAIRHTDLPKPCVDPHSLTHDQINFLVNTFGLNLKSLNTNYPEFDKLLRQNFNVELSRNRIVIFMLLSIIRRFPKAFSFKGNELGRFEEFEFSLELSRPLPPSDSLRKYNARDVAEIIPWLEKLIALGCYKIVDSATFVSNIHVVYKDGKAPRPTGDYRLLNKCTKDAPPNINHMERVLGWTINIPFRYISDCDNNKGFYQCPVAKETQPLMALRSPLGIAQPLTCSMGPKQVPGHFTQVVSHVLGPGNWKGIAAFVDNIHVKGEDAFLQLLWIGYLLYRKELYKMTLDLSKCHWLMEKLRSLGYLTGNMTIQPDPEKVAAILKLRRPENVAEIRQYLGMLTFYARFFPEYSTKFQPLQDIVNKKLNQYHKSNPKERPVKKNNDDPLAWTTTSTAIKHIQEGSGDGLIPMNQIPELVDDIQAERPVPKNKSKREHRYLSKIPMEWTQECIEAYEYSRQWLSSSPILVSYKPNYPVIISVDSSLTAQNGIVEQYQPAKYRLVLAYISRKVTGLKRMWASTLLELDGLCYALKKAAPFIEVGDFTVITDHRALQFIREYKGENRKILERALFLSEFGDRLVIVHKPGYLFLRADPLSRLVAHVITAYTITDIQKPDLLHRIRLETEKDNNEHIRKLIKQLESDKFPIDENSQWWYTDGLLRHRNSPTEQWRLYVPATLRTEILNDAHNNSGHLRYNKLIKALTANFWWPKFTKTILTYLDECIACQESIPRTTRLPGLLQNLDNASELGRWTIIHIDFLFHFPKSPATGNDGCLGITCRFSNRLHLWPCKSTITAAEFAQLFISRYIPLHGLPDRIISDRDPKFISGFWTTIREMLALKHNMSTTDHPQTDGLQERMFRRTNQLLRTMVNSRQDDWESFLPLVEFHLNSVPRKGINKTPFEIDLGYQPTLTLANELLQHEGARHAAAEELMDNFKNTDLMIQNTIKEMRQEQNARRSENRAILKFEKGDKVFLNTSHIKEFCNKLAKRWLGPLKILEVLKYDTYKLQFPPRFKKMHPVVHVSKLKPARISDQQLTKTAGNYENINEEDNETPTIEAIVDHRTRRNKLEFRVRFEDLAAAHDQWLPANAIPDPLLIKSYREQNPHRSFALYMPYVWW